MRTVTVSPVSDADHKGGLGGSDRRKPDHDNGCRQAEPHLLSKVIHDQEIPSPVQVEDTSVLIAFLSLSTATPR